MGWGEGWYVIFSELLALPFIMSEVKWAILIYHTAIDNQLVELFLFCDREPLYKVWAAPVLG